MTKNQNEKIENILILTHGNLGNELIKSAKMIIGDIKNVEAISLMPSDTFEEYLLKVKSKLKSNTGRILVFVDMFGGTPSNIAISLSREYNLTVIGGINLPMLIEAITSLDNYNYVELSKILIESGKNSCKDIIKAFNEKIEKRKEVSGE